jgi:hypothetical protein
VEERENDVEGVELENHYTWSYGEYVREWPIIVKELLIKN